MTTGIEKLVLPTERRGIILKTSTSLDDEAWLLAHRLHPSKYRPSHPNAPDHFDDFVNMQKKRQQELRRQQKPGEPLKLNMGIWNASDVNRIIFAGFVELQRDKKADDSATVTCDIIKARREQGYATTALQAIMKYGRERFDITTYRARVPQSNYAARYLAEELGFKLEADRNNYLTYVLPPAPETILPAAPVPASQAA